MQVDIPEIGIVEFPDTMSEQEVASAIRTKLIPQVQQFTSIGKLSAPPVSPVGVNALSGRAPGGVPAAPDAVPEIFNPRTTNPKVAFAQNMLGDVRDIITQQPTETPRTFLEGVRNSAIHGAQGLVTPEAGAFAVATMFPPLLPVVLGIGAGMGAAGIGEVAGNLAGTPDKTAGQWAEGIGDIAQQSLMVLPAPIHPLLPTPRPVVPAPGNPEYAPYINKQLARQNTLAPRDQGGTPPPPAVIPPASPVAPATPVAPSFFETGRVMPATQPPMEMGFVPPQPVMPVPAVKPVAPKTAPASQPFKTEIPATAPAPANPFEAYTDAVNRLKTAVPGSAEHTAAWQQIEAIKNQNGGATPVNPNAKANPVVASPAATPAVPASLPKSVPQVPATAEIKSVPATKVGDVIIQGQHGAEGMLQFAAERKKNPAAPVIRGFLVNDVFYNTPLEAARAVEQLKGKQNAQQTVMPAEGQKAVTPQAAVPATPPVEIPGNAGQGTGGARGADAQVSGGEVGPKYPISFKNGRKVDALGRPVDKDNNLITEPKPTGESGFFRFFGGADMSRLGIKPDTKVQGEQMYNRIKNTLGERSAAFTWMDDAGLKAFLAQPKSVRDVEQWLGEIGPKIETHSYGMEGKVSEAKKEYDKMTHEWLDSKPGPTRTAILRAIDMMDTDRHEQANQHLAQLSDKDIDMTRKYAQLRQQIEAEPRDKSLKATHHYSTVSALDTAQPMPDWTATKSGKNVQRVDVVVPQKKITGQDAVEEMRNYMTGEGYNANRAKQQHNKLENILWQPDNLHENLPNTPIWNMIQYKTGPKGERIAVIVENQGSWIQAKHAYESALKKGKSEKEAYQLSVKAGSGRGYRPHQDHPLLQHAQRLGLKAAIEQARKEGATHIMISDAETAMMTEGHDAQAAAQNKYKTSDAIKGIKVPVYGGGEGILTGLVTEYPNYQKRYGVNIEGRGDIQVSPDYLPEVYQKILDNELKTTIAQEPGMRLNYDTILPKIAEELTGSKGERVSLGEHKNAMEPKSRAAARETGDDAGATAQLMAMNGEANTSVPRSNLIFRNADGTPKTDVSGTLFPIDKVDTSKFTVFEKDKAGSVQKVDKTGEAGSVIGPQALFDSLKDMLSKREKFRAIVPQFKNEDPSNKGSYVRFNVTGKEYIRADRGDLETALHEVVHSFTANNKDAIVAQGAKLSLADKQNLVRLVRNLGSSYRIHADALQRAIDTGKDNAGLWRSLDELTAQASTRKFWNNGDWTVNTARDILNKVYGEEMTGFLEHGEITKDTFYPKWDAKKGEFGAVIGPAAIAAEVKRHWDNAKDAGKDLFTAVTDGDAWKAALLSRQGYDLPKIEAKSPELADKVAAFANVHAAAGLRANVEISKALGDKLGDSQFRKQLGGVIYEDMREASGGTGNPVWTLNNSPFADAAQYQAAKNSPEMQVAISNWKHFIQDPATKMHQELGGTMSDVGKDTGAFANLIAVLASADPEFTGQSSGPLSTMKRGSAFNRERKFSGKEYNLDAVDMARRMMTKNASEVQKRQVYEKLEEAGLGKLLKPGEDTPDGMVRFKNPVTLRSIVTKDAKGNVESANISRWLAVDKSIAPEIQQAFQLDTPLRDKMEQDFPAAARLSQMIIRAQVALGIDLGFHTVNDALAVLNSPKGLLATPAKIKAIASAGVELVKNDIKIQEELAQMAERGVSFRGESMGGWSSQFLRLADNVTRVVLNREYDHLVSEGRVVNSNAERRRYVNGRAGQYNKRFMTYFQQSMQETGLGSFNVAGRNFNRLAIGNLTASPGVKAVNMKEATRLRLAQALGIATAAVLTPAAINYASTGEFQPEGTEIGDIVVGKNKDGTFKILNMRKWTMLDRGARATGLKSVMNEQVLPALRGEPRAGIGHTVKSAAAEALKTAAAPFAGPPVNMVSTLATGKTELGLGYEQRTPGESGPPYWKAAIGTLNPLAGPVMTGSQHGSTAEHVVDRFGSIVGIGNAASPFNTIRQRASQYKNKMGIVQNEASFAPSEYIPLKQALQSDDMEQAQKEYVKIIEAKSKKHPNLDPEAARGAAMMDMQKEFAKMENFRFVNKENEAAFKASLSPDQRKMYDAAVQQQKELAAKFWTLQAKKQQEKSGGFNLPKLGGFKTFK
jgi:hypothetical protein